MNLFDTKTYPTIEPPELISGDRWAWKRVDLASAYDTSEFTLTYSCRLEGQENLQSEKIDITAASSAGEFLIEVASTDTAKYSTGTYHWQAYITRISDDERVTVDKGVFSVKPNKFDDVSDPRSLVKQTLDALNAVMLKKASRDQQKFSLPNGLSVDRLLPDDLLKLIKHYNILYSNELRSEKIKRGESIGMSVRVRF